MRGCNKKTTKITDLNRKLIFQLFREPIKEVTKRDKACSWFCEEKRELSLRFFFGFLSGQVNVAAIDAFFVPEVRVANVSFSFDFEEESWGLPARV